MTGRRVTGRRGRTVHLLRGPRWAVWGASWLKKEPRVLASAQPHGGAGLSTCSGGPRGLHPGSGKGLECWPVHSPGAGGWGC